MPHLNVHIPKLEKLIPSHFQPVAFPIIAIVVEIYFYLVYYIFEFFNSFWEQKVVSTPKDPLILQSATVLAEKIRRREVKSIDVINAYIRRIDEVNGLINAVALRNFEEAIQKAKEVDELIATMSDEELTEYTSTRPLLGLPFTVKDGLTIKGNIVTMGMWRTRHAVGDITGDAMQRLFDAGAILLAVSTVPETCMHIETYSAVFGRTRNPYDSRRTCGGSSGGEGALLGAAASLMGVGADSAGSTRFPSFVNGVFGMMPSVGVVLPSGKIPSTTLEDFKGRLFRIGPMTRFAEDLLLLVEVMGHKGVPCGVSDLRKLSKIVFVNGLTHFRYIEPLSYQTKSAMDDVVHHFESEFGISAKEETFPLSEKAIEYVIHSNKPPGTITVEELMNRNRLPNEAPCKPWKEFFKYFAGRSEHAMHTILSGLTDMKDPYNEEERKEIETARDQMRQDIIDMIGDDGLLFFPSFPTLAPFHNELLWKETSIMHTGLFNTMCLPIIQCPTGITADGIPNGVMIIGAPNSDRLLIAAANEIQRKFGGWVPPGKL